MNKYKYYALLITKFLMLAAMAVTDKDWWPFG